MPQSSAPISQGTVAQRQLTDVIWRDLFGQEPGVLSDMNGTAYALTLPGSGDIVSVGSSTQASLASVAGFVHKIPQGSPDTITIPAASGSARTDIIALRYDPSYTGAPGPVRLFRIAGSGTALPAYNAVPSSGVEEMPLWSITRSPGQNLSQATVTRMYSRLAPSIDLPAGAPLPTNSPLGTRVYQGTAEWRRALDASNNPVWVAVPTQLDIKVGQGSATTNSTGYFSVNHTLGKTPTFIGITSRRVGSSDSQTFIVSARTATNFTARAYWTNQPNVNVAVDFDYMVAG